MASLPSDECQRQWGLICNLLFSEWEDEEDVKEAVLLASSCEHPDARWVVSLCAEKTISDLDDLLVLFEERARRNEPLGLAFAWMLGDQSDLAPLYRAADQNCAFAQACLAWKLSGTERFKFARLAFLQGEPDGSHWLGFAYEHGDGCEKDLEKAKEAYTVAGASFFSFFSPFFFWSLF
jgi:hypothetical protein